MNGKRVIIDLRFIIMIANVIQLLCVLWYVWDNPFFRTEWPFTFVVPIFIFSGVSTVFLHYRKSTVVLQKQIENKDLLDTSITLNENFKNNRITSFLLVNAVVFGAGTGILFVFLMIEIINGEIEWERTIDFNEVVFYLLILSNSFVTIFSIVGGMIRHVKQD